MSYDYVKGLAICEINGTKFAVNSASARQTINNLYNILEKPTHTATDTANANNYINSLNSMGDYSYITSGINTTTWIYPISRHKALYPLPQPSSVVWNDNDVSSSDAGRTDDGVMHKNKIGTSTKVELKWSALYTNEASKIIQAVEGQEYFDVVFFDLKANDYISRRVYCGDRSAPMYNSFLDLWEKVSVNLIEVGVH